MSGTPAPVITCSPTRIGASSRDASATADDGAACHPNDADACLPNDSDVDCAGGSGNGQSYPEGQGRVVAPHVYDLDQDDDGIDGD